MELTNTICQLDRKGNTASEMIFTVDYDPKEQVVTELVKVEVYDVKTRVTTDITIMMWQQFENDLEKLVAKVDWPEIYATDKANNLEAFHEYWQA